MTDVTNTERASRLRLIAEHIWAIRGSSGYAEELVELADVLDPKPPALRERVCYAIVDAYPPLPMGHALAAADAVLAVIADDIGAMPRHMVNRDAIASVSEDRAAVLRRLRGERPA